MRTLSTFLKGIVIPAALGVATAASAAPITYTAVIRVDQASTGTPLGYISKNSVNNQAQYKYDPLLSNALVVDFTLDSGVTSSSGVDLIAENSDIPNFSYVGLVQGRDDTNSTLQAGSYHYAYIAGTNPTPPNSTPQLVGNSYNQAFVSVAPRTSESAVWTLDLIAGTIAPVWTNPDGSTPPLDLFIQSTGLYVGGDQAAFGARYPAPLTPYTLHLSILSQTIDVPEPASWSIAMLGLLAAGMARRGRRAGCR